MKITLSTTIKLLTLLLSFITSASMAQITSSASGNWSAPSTWIGGVVPTSTTNVVVAAGHTVAVDNASASCNSISFGANTSKLSMAAATSVLSVYGDFSVFSTTHSVFTTWAAGAKLKFTGAAPVQALSVITTSNTTLLTTFFMEIVVDKSTGKVTTPGGDVKINIGTSLEIVNGSFELSSTADIQGRSLDGNLATTPFIKVFNGGTFNMEGGASHIGSGTVGTPRPPIGKLTVIGNANLACGSTNKMSFSDVDIESGGQVDMPAGRGASTSAFAPGTITVKSGGVFKSSTTAAYWTAPSTLIVNTGGEFNSAVAGTTSLPSTLTLNPGSTVRYSLSAAQPLANISTYENLIITNPGVKSLSTNITVNGIFSIRGSATFALNTFTLTYGPLATLQYGSFGQAIAQNTTDEEWPSTGSTPSNVTVYNTGGVTLHASRTVSSILTLSAGLINIGANNLTTDSITGGSTSAFVNTNGTGFLRMINVASSAVLFPVGLTTYNPVTIANAGTADDFSVNVSTGTPCNAVLGNSVNRTWNITEANAGGSNAMISFQWNTTEENVAFIRTNSAVIGCSGAGITLVGTTGPASGTGPYSQSITNVSALSSFGVSNSLIDFSATGLVTPTNGGCKTSGETVTVSIKNNAAVPIDFAKNNLTVNVTATGGYSSSLLLLTGSIAAGASQNVIMPATIDMSAGGNFTFNANTTSAADVNTANDAMAAVNISATPGPGAVITYAANPFCKSVTIAQAVTRTGTTGGTYSSTPGLTLDPNTGAIIPSTSTAGTYTVTYTIPASGGCGVVNSTTQVNITEIPSGTIQYAGSPYCTNGGTATVTRNATAGGTFTVSPGGLSINASTGDINLAGSTANTYIVTYTVPATGGCSSFSTTASVTVNQFQNAGFNFGGQTTFCQSAPNPVATISGNTGGTFSATPAGLVFLSTSTGEINLSASQLNSYTINYTTAGPCANSSNLNIVITSAPSASFSYASSAFCKNAANPSPVYGPGAGAGTFSATPVGLTFVNNSTGQIDLTNSSAGTYTVTNFIAAGNGCSSATSSTTVIITSVPSATINYAGSPFCSSLSASQLVTRTGSPGGTFSSTTGLSVNAASGEILPSSSTAGTYTVTYTVPASGGCAVYTTTTSVTISAAPSATITYNSAPFCTSVSALQPVTRSGTTGGTYSSTPGLTLNAGTGAITPSTSTAGTYTVIYTMPSSGGCTNATATTTVTVTAAPSASISYSGSPFCGNSPSANVTRTGTSGGTFSSTTGLSIDPVSGNINITSSSPGTYTVSYSVAAAGGCAAYNTNTTVSIRAVSIAPTGITSNITASCGSNTLNLTVQGGSLNTGATWNWYSESCGGTLIGTGATLSNIPITATTTYFVRAEGGACSNVQCASTVVTVSNIPQISIAASADTILLPGMSTTLTATVSPVQAGNTIIWLKNGVVVPGATNSSLVVDVENLGSYTARVTTTAGCTSTSTAIRVSGAVSDKVFISANPNNGKFKVRYYSSATNFNFSRYVMVYDSRGSRVFSSNLLITGAYSSMDVDISNHKKGIYIVRVVKSNGEKLGAGMVVVQ